LYEILLRRKNMVWIPPVDHNYEQNERDKRIRYI
jgi:hypothetical protein